MNLGGIEQIAQAVATEALLDHAKETEKKLDERINKLEQLDEDDFEKLREKRRLQLQKQQVQQQAWRANGHGTYSELADQGEFFSAGKRSSQLVVHFYRPTTARCAIVDARLGSLARRHLETRFVRIDAEKSPYLVEKLGIAVMPTMLLVKDGQTVHQIRGFDELGGTDDFHEDTLAWVIAQWGCCKYEGEPPEDPTKSRRGVNSIGMAFAGRANVREGGGRDSDDDLSD